MAIATVGCGSSGKSATSAQRATTTVARPTNGALNGPMLGAIEMFPGNYAPAGWHLCDGAALPVRNNVVLFGLLGTRYGGDGKATFNLPNMPTFFPNVRCIIAVQGFFPSKEGGGENNLLAGEVGAFGGTFAPGASHFCDGAALDTREYGLLFYLIQNRFGGDEATHTFNLPKVDPFFPNMTCAVGVDAPGRTANDETGGADQFLLQMRLFAGTTPPPGWYACDGAALKVSENQPAYTLIGTMFGGDGKETFNLPKVEDPFPNIHCIIALKGYFPARP